MKEDNKNEIPLNRSLVIILYRILILVEKFITNNKHTMQVLSEPVLNCNNCRNTINCQLGHNIWKNF